MKIKIMLKNQIEFCLFKIFLLIFGLLPYKFVRKSLGKLFLWGGKLFNIRRSVAAKQLHLIFPKKSETEREDILDKMYFNMGITAAEMYFADPKRLFQDVQVTGWENLQNAVDQKRGVILASFHAGNWELAGKYIAQYFKLSVIVKKQRNYYFDQYTNELRRKNNIKIISKKNSLRQIMKLVKENFIVTILIDQSAGKNGVLTDFLGYPASTYIGAAKIALKTGAPIVPSIAIRNKDGSHNFIFEQVIQPEDFKIKTKPAITLIEYISKVLEKYIYQYPEQWFWVHKRWKHDKAAKKTLQKSF